jgi:putative acetyltransferase
MEIRQAKASDVAEVVALVRTVLAEFGLAYGDGAETDRQLESLPASYEGQGGRFWVALRDGRIVGTAGIFPVDRETFELRKMYLDLDARGLGLGRRLLDQAIAYAREAGARRIVLDTADRMVRAISFYEANGFVRDDTQRRADRCDRGYVLALV